MGSARAELERCRRGRPCPSQHQRLGASTTDRPLLRSRPRSVLLPATNLSTGSLSRLGSPRQSRHLLLAQRSPRAAPGLVQTLFLPEHSRHQCSYHPGSVQVFYRWWVWWSMVCTSTPFMAKEWMRRGERNHSISIAAGYVRLNGVDCVSVKGDKTSRCSSEADCVVMSGHGPGGRSWV